MAGMVGIKTDGNDNSCWDGTVIVSNGGKTIKADGRQQRGVEVEAMAWSVGARALTLPSTTSFDSPFSSREKWQPHLWGDFSQQKKL